MEELLSQQLRLLQEQLVQINAKLDVIAKQTEKMDTHVDFVEGVYTTVKTPLTAICNIFNGYTQTELPQIEGIRDNDDETQ